MKIRQAKKVLGQFDIKSLDRFYRAYQVWLSRTTKTHNKQRKNAKS